MKIPTGIGAVWLIGASLSAIVWARPAAAQAQAAADYGLRAQSESNSPFIRRLFRGRRRNGRGPPPSPEAPAAISPSNPDRHDLVRQAGC